MNYKELLSRAKAAAKLLYNGRTNELWEDEYVQYYFTPLVATEGQHGNHRLNILVSNLSARASFGGVATLVELPMLIFKHHLKDLGWTLRYISLNPASGDDDNIVKKYCQRHELNDVEIIYPGKDKVPVAELDVFMGSLWQNYYDALPLREFQKQRFKHSVKYVSLVQDYEAGFQPWSSAYMLAQSVYNQRDCLEIFNSKELLAYYRTCQHPINVGYAFDPVMNDRLRSILLNGRGINKKKKILFYGRPEDRRNCFYIVRTAIEKWSHLYDKASDWEVVSVGVSHKPINVHRDVKVTIRGKLTIEEYAQELSESAVGVSLMASPHPSYPPLEMAHFGAITLTNSFLCKDLSSWHENIVSLDILTPENLAEALCHACEKFSQNPAYGINGKSRKPGYMDGFPETALKEMGHLISESSKLTVKDSTN